MGVDEIQQDYVRFPTEGDVEDAVFSFPDSLTREGVITGFIRRVRDRLKGSPIRLSADVFGIVAWGREVDKQATGQSISDLLDYLDVVSPMLYPSHFYGSFEGMDIPAEYPYYFLFEGCRSLRRFVDGRDVIIRPWIQAFTYRVDNFDSGYVAEQIRGAESGGGRGWLLWNSAMRYSLGLQAIDAVVNGDGAVAGSDVNGRWKRKPDRNPRAGSGRDSPAAQAESASATTTASDATVSNSTTSVETEAPPGGKAAAESETESEKAPPEVENPAADPETKVEGTRENSDPSAPPADSASPRAVSKR